MDIAFFSTVVGPWMFNSSGVLEELPKEVWVMMPEKWFKKADEHV
jgi:hypothetical protein